MTCRECFGPILPKRRFQLLADSLAYDLFLALPNCIAFSRVGFLLLPYAGTHAYTCTCPAKVLDLMGDAA